MHVQPHQQGLFAAPRKTRILVLASLAAPASQRAVFLSQKPVLGVILQVYRFTGLQVFSSVSGFARGPSAIPEAVPGVRRLLTITHADREVFACVSDSVEHPRCKNWEVLYGTHSQFTHPVVHLSRGDAIGKSSSSPHPSQLAAGR